MDDCILAAGPPVTAAPLQCGPSFIDSHHRLLVDAAKSQAMYVLDPGGIVLSWNSGAGRLTGYDASEVLGQHFSRFYTLEDRGADLPRQVLQRAASEAGFETGCWHVRRDGSRFWAGVALQGVRSTAGDLLGFANVTCDRSETKRLETALQRSEEHVKILVQGIKDCAIYMLDADGRVVNWNAGAQRIKGYRPAEIIGQSFARFYDEQSQRDGEPKAALDGAVRDGRYQGEGWRVRRDGSHFWADVVIDVIWDQKGAVIGFANTTHDITEIRKTRMALEETREALFQMQKLEAIGLLAAGVAHDFNNILQAIVSSLELVLDEVGEAAPAFAIASAAINLCMRGSSLTHHLLSYARKQVSRPQRVEVAGLLGETKALLGRTLGPHIITRVRAKPGPAVLADPGQLQTALLNLAINASHAMPHGGDLTLSAEQAGDGAAWVTITVADTGCGMDTATLAQVTEPFFTTKGSKGSGLGLSMVQGFAEQSRGTLRIESSPGAGTAVALRLPLADPESPAPPAQAATCHGVHARVLLVDDAAEILANMGAALESAGYAVWRAASGAAALALLAAGERFDVLVTDYAMPGMNGAALIAAARDVQPDLLVVQMTGYAGVSYAGVPASVATVLNKPFQRADLIVAVQTALAQAARA